MMVSAVIPAFNAERFVAEAIESVLGQVHVQVECIVVDDGSTDRTAEVVGRYGERVRLLRQANAGVSAARNNGAAAGSGSFVAFLDADDRWHPAKLERQLAALRDAAPQIVTVCAVRAMDEVGDPLGDRTWHCPSGLLRGLVMFDGARTISCSSTVLMPRALFESIGGFERKLSMSADLDLLIRIARRGEVAIINEPLVDYRVHAGSMSSDVALMERDMLIVFERLFHGEDALQWPVRERRRAYANLHRMLAGSYLKSCKPGMFLRHARRSAQYDPRALGYLLRLRR
ncbi:MAG: glycosyltransferase family 2 protein [Solirubrobacteraceae bacterium]